MSHHRVDERRKLRRAEESSDRKVVYGGARIEYVGPAPNTFAGGALGGGVGAVLGFLLAGPLGAAIAGGLGAFIGGFIGAQIDEATKELAKSESKEDRS